VETLRREYCNVVTGDDDGRTLFVAGVRQCANLLWRSAAREDGEIALRLSRRSQTGGASRQTDDRSVLLGSWIWYLWSAVAHMGNSLSQSPVPTAGHNFTDASGIIGMCSLRPDGLLLLTGLIFGLARPEATRVDFCLRLKESTECTAQNRSRAFGGLSLALGDGGKPVAIAQCDACGVRALCQNAFGI